MRCTDTPQPHAANLHGWDFAALAEELGPPVTPITDIHTHLRGAKAVAIFKHAADLYGIERVWSMTPLHQVDAVVDVLGDRVAFIAVPDWRHEDPRHAHGEGFDESIRTFARAGAKLCKFWTAPRAMDYGRELGDPTFLHLDGDTRRRQIELAASLGMGIMTHIADPDTWFATTYADADRYGTKQQQYEQLERMLEAVAVPWLAAHMGGSPEDLDHLDLLLERYPHLHLDTSAAKWMIREISAQSTERVHAFMRRWQGRIAFGTDIVTQDEHLFIDDTDNSMSAKASSAEQAFDLYASRMWALRMLWEGHHRGPSPIADPDLHLVDPAVDPMASPMLVGHALPAEDLQALYTGAADSLFEQIDSANASRHAPAS